MKNTLTTLLASQLFLTGFCQNPEYEIRLSEPRPVTKETLNKANTLTDFIPGYPENWISSYVSVELLATCDGKLRKAMGPTETLTTKQRNILNTVDLGTVIVVNVNYKYDNLATNSTENNRIHVSMTVVPEKEAEYIGGREEMNKYLKKNIADKISNTYPSGPKGSSRNSQAVSGKLQQGTVMFTVNEEGDVVNPRMSKTSGDPTADKLIVDGISKMPKWKPAENSKGAKVKQEFVFNVGNDGC